MNWMCRMFIAFFCARPSDAQGLGILDFHISRAPACRSKILNTWLLFCTFAFFVVQLHNRINQLIDGINRLIDCIRLLLMELFG